MKDIFTHFYHSNYWRGKESKSGTGSSLEQTQELINKLDKLFLKLNISTILDIPCGDFNWMKHLPLKNYHYLGADIVEEIIESNLQTYKSDNVDFSVLDITTDSFPDVDIILVRDCLVHFPFDYIYKTFENLKKQNYKYILMTSFTARPHNTDLFHVGEWRPLNMEEAPFNLPKPSETLNENCTEENSTFSDKSMCLWTKESFESACYSLDQSGYSQNSIQI